MAPSTTDATASLKATYTNSHSQPTDSSPSSTTPFTLSTPLSLPSSDSAAHKTTYLASLREAVTTLQERVNSELTVRMEAEARETAAASASTNGKGGKGTGAGGVDEAAEEENYGEEVVEGDEE
ncbi:hypothetical protein GGS26DRAFT_593083 [Hypomontagnella submonticulosa]|nr:hypothetical protein GGS26DRAFT_593083 [Hypomontagnella submonticulosa]